LADKIPALMIFTTCSSGLIPISHFNADGTSRLLLSVTLFIISILYQNNTLIC